MKDIKKEVLLDKKLYERLFVGTLLASFVLWIIMIFVGGEGSRQFNLFFLNCNDFLADFTNGNGYCGERDPYNNVIYTGLGEKGYPPLPYIFHYMFSRLIDIEYFNELGSFTTMYFFPKLLIMFIIVTIIIIVSLYELVRNYKDGSNLIKILTAFAIICSWPVLYALERGNTIIVTSVFLMFYIFYNKSDNKFIRELSLISLAIAAAFKLTPAIFGIILLYEKRWKEAFRTILYGLFLFFVPFLFFRGGFENLLLMFRNIRYHMMSYTADQGCTFLGGFLYYGFSNNEFMSSFSKILTYLVCVILIVGYPFQKFIYDKILFITLVLLLLPSHSAIYCLVYLIPVMVMFLNEKDRRYSDIAILIAFLMIMVTFQSDVGYVFFNNHLGILLLAAVSVVRAVKGIDIWWKDRVEENDDNK